MVEQQQQQQPAGGSELSDADRSGLASVSVRWGPPVPGLVPSSGPLSAVAATEWWLNNRSGVAGTRVGGAAEHTRLRSCKIIPKLTSSSFTYFLDHIRIISSTKRAHMTKVKSCRKTYADKKGCGMNKRINQQCYHKAKQELRNAMRLTT